MTIEELREKADSLGITYHPQTGVTKLNRLINEHKSPEDTEDVEEPVEKEVKKVVKKTPKPPSAIKYHRYVSISSMDPTETQIKSQYTSVLNEKTAVKAYPVPLNTPIMLPVAIINVLSDIRFATPVMEERGDMNFICNYNIKKKYNIKYLD